MTALAGEPDGVAATSTNTVYVAVDPAAKLMAVTCAPLAVPHAFATFAGLNVHRLVPLVLMKVGLLKFAPACSFNVMLLAVLPPVLLIVTVYLALLPATQLADTGMDVFVSTSFGGTFTHSVSVLVITVLDVCVTDALLNRPLPAVGVVVLHWFDWPALSAVPVKERSISITYECVAWFLMVVAVGKPETMVRVAPVRLVLLQLVALAGDVMSLLVARIHLNASIETLAGKPGVSVKVYVWSAPVPLDTAKV